MKKVIVAFVSMLLMSLIITGCGKNQIPDLTEDEIKAIGEYTAFTLMKYDANHRSRLVDLSKYEEQNQETSMYPEESETEETNENPSEENVGIEDTPIVDITPEESYYDDSYMKGFFGLPEEVTITYSGVSLCQTYPEDGNGLFNIAADTGKQLLVIHFLLENESEQEQMVDVFGLNMKFMAEVNDEAGKYCLTTLLPEDLSTMREELCQGQRLERVLLVEVDYEVQTISSLKLKLIKDTNVYPICLK